MRRGETSTDSPAGLKASAIARAGPGRHGVTWFPDSPAITVDLLHGDIVGRRVRTGEGAAGPVPALQARPRYCRFPSASDDVQVGEGVSLDHGGRGGIALTAAQHPPCPRQGQYDDEYDWGVVER